MSSLLPQALEVFDGLSARRIARSTDARRARMLVTLAKGEKTFMEASFSEQAWESVVLEAGLMVEKMIALWGTDSSWGPA